MEKRHWIERPILVMDLSRASKRLGARIDGFVGQDILREFSAVRIDYRAGVVEFDAAGRWAMSKEHRLKPRKSKALAEVALNFLLGCSESSLASFELARLDEIANLRRELQATLDRMLDQIAQAALAGWFRQQDRTALRHAIENEETPEEWAKRMIRDGQRSPEELLPLPTLEPGAAHLAAAVRYQERNIGKGKCSVCPKPLEPNSVRYCTKHLAMARTKSARQRGAKGEPGSRDYLYSEVQESTHGRQPGTLASLAMNRERKTRALLAEPGIGPESAAVSLKAAKETQLAAMPDKTHAVTQTALFYAAGVVTKTTGQRALNVMLAEKQIQRIGKGGMRDVYRYFRV